MNVTQKYVLVTGPQRSGTRIAAKIIAHDSSLAPPHRYVDETEIHTDSLYALDILLRVGEPVVVQCPALCRYVHYFGKRDDVLVIMMKRNGADIQASMKRIGWAWESLEMFRYDEMCLSIVTAKYTYWREAQEEAIEHSLEIEYESLAGHPLWVPRAERMGFEATQTEVTL